MHLSIISGLRFPFERVSCFGWRVADLLASSSIQSSVIDATIDAAIQLVRGVRLARPESGRMSGPVIPPQDRRNKKGQHMVLSFLRLPCPAQRMPIRAFWFRAWAL